MSSVFNQRTHRSGALLPGIVVLAAFAVLTHGPACGEPVPAHRVVIRFQEDGNQGKFFEVISWNAVTKVLPPSDELPTKSNPVSGFYYELQSSDGTVLYRRIIENPFLLVVEGHEIFTQTIASDQQLTNVNRKLVIPKERIFSLLIPRADAGDQLVLFSSPFKPEQRASLQQIGRHPDAAEEMARLFFTPSTSQ